MLLFPLGIEELISVMEKIEGLVKLNTWQDSAWRDELAAAAEEIKQVGQKLAQASEKLDSLSGFVALGKVAEKAGNQYLEALRCCREDPMNLISAAIYAGISMREAALLAQGLMMAKELEGMVCRNCSQN